ncbi:hypothetical protein M8J76_017127 [Diaphorina citri]|nr:hypothetical protein M8J75_001075 [Diaphorina citri]KAI5750615.1 hypothetical protein M8J76_017127 [Diaphorina citri]KAI5756066.1 hypothetical protein M8J77_021760 [Diaphorina citri]
MMEWSPGGGTPQQLSVVTTVWGVTTSTQSGPNQFVGGLGSGNSEFGPGGQPHHHTIPGKQGYQSGYRQTGPG